MARRAFEVDWGRRPTTEFERETVKKALRQLIEYHGQNPHPLALRDTVIPIVLNVWDAYLTNSILRVVPRSARNYCQERKIDPDLIQMSILTLHDLGVLHIRKIESGRGFSGYLLDSGTPFWDGHDTQKAEVLDYSDPLDVHKWSDHPEVNALVDLIHEQAFSHHTAIRRKHLKVLLLDLYVRWSTDPHLKTSVARNANAYRARSRYNSLHISRLTPDIVDILQESGLVHQAMGYRQANGKSRVARIWPTRHLIELFEAARFGPLDVWDHEGREVIILRETHPDKPNASGEIDYVDTAETNRMRAVLHGYNDLLRRSFVDIPTLESTYLELKTDRKGRSHRLAVNQHDKFTRRIFNRGSFAKGGRFWGGWWQRCPAEWRQKIYINDLPTSEVDYSGHHIVMLYANEGIDYWSEVGDDPYLLTGRR